MRISFEHVVYSHFFPIYMDSLGRLQFHLRKINYRPRDCYKYCILVYNIVMHEECMFLSSPLSWKKLHWVNRFNQWYLISYCFFIKLKDREREGGSEGNKCTIYEYDCILDSYFLIRMWNFLTHYTKYAA